MFKALAAENINIKVITTSEIKISVLIDRKYMELAVQALHDAFELERPDLAPLPEGHMPERTRKRQPQAAAALARHALPSRARARNGLTASPI